MTQYSVRAWCCDTAVSGVSAMVTGIDDQKAVNKVNNSVNDSATLTASDTSYSATIGET